jgi:hypothetical protein
MMLSIGPTGAPVVNDDGRGKYVAERGSDQHGCHRLFLDGTTALVVEALTDVRGLSPGLLRRVLHGRRGGPARLRRLLHERRRAIRYRTAAELVYRLPDGALNLACTLIELALDLRAGVAGEPTDRALDLAFSIPHGTRNAIFVHLCFSWLR